jgi:hypothetical protein
MRVSKYINIDKNILIEYIYDDGNLIGESYKIGVNIKDKNYNYMAGDNSATLNTISNSLFIIDPIANTYGVYDTTKYSFLQVKDYSSGFPTRHDIIKIHLPINYTFGEYLGIYIRAYAFDSTGRKTCDLSNFYYDISNIDQTENTKILNYTNPPLYFLEKLWGKTISLNIPSIYAVANQRGSDVVKQNSINYNLTNGVGLDLSAPLFIDFHFIESKSTVNSLVTYTLTPKKTISVSQSPEFENMGVKIEESVNGDFFEIYAMYNNSIGEFNDFINKSVSLGNRYYVEYDITLYEQNIRGKSQKIVVLDDFLSKVEFRPIIKYSTTTAIIDVEMNLVDAVDNSRITRRASYGMLQDQVSKYSLRLMKINLSNASKPKIYNQKNILNVGTMQYNVSSQGNVVVETVKVPYPVLIDRHNVVAKSDSAINGNSVFYGIGKLVIVIYPFDNIFKIIIAKQINDNGTVDYMDLTNMGEIKMVIKNQNLTIESNLYNETGEIDLSKGFLSFKITSGKINDIKKIYESGSNVFYITSNQQNTSTVIYSGLYRIYDSAENITTLNQTAINEVLPIEPVEVIPQVDGSNNDVAIATRRVNVNNTLIPSSPSGTNINVDIQETPSEGDA